jgi:hypothetical protein
MTKVFQGKRQTDMERNFEKLASHIASLGRSEVERGIRNFKGTFRLDFTDDYIRGLTIERLRHILFAAMANKLEKTD